MENAIELKNLIVSNLRRHGLKVTRQRELILEHFMKIDHITVEGLHAAVRKRDPRIGKITVYRTLKQLCRIGLASERHFQENHAIYDNIVRKRHHDHLICIRCGRIVEFSNDAIERIQKTVARKNGFTITGHRLEISGVCPGCR